MKAQILKIAGVKNEKEFYKKFPTEEAFLKKHGKELKKAAGGASVDGASFFADTTSTYGYDPNAYIPTPTGTGAIPTFGSKIKGLGSSIKQGMKESSETTGMSIPSGLAGMVGGISAGINSINQTDRNIEELEKYGKVSDVVLAAANTRPERIKNRYVRPEDVIIQPGELGRPYGEGTNYLAAENGAEIANTFAPNTIYTDGGYEPLNDSSKVKTFEKGGKLRKAFAGEAIGLANSAADISRASGQIGGGLASQWSAAGGETGGWTQVLGAFGLAGGLLGGYLDAPQIKKKQELQSHLDNNLGLIGTQATLQSQFSPNFEDGGWVSNDWQPQTITKFGEYNMNELLAPPHDADMLRAGGHLKEYTPPSAAAMYTGRMEDGGQMALGGDLKVLDGGYAETISYNPYMPGTGETVMFRGRSHDNGGIPITYGENGVEVEGGEPMYQMEDGGQMGTNTSGIVGGNMPISAFAAEQIGDPKAKDKKYKNLIADYAKVEAKQNKIIDRSTQLANNVDASDAFDKLSLQAAQANLLGANMKLKDIAEKKMNVAAVQNAILDTAKEYGLVSDQLAKGKIVEDKEAMKKAKFGAKMETFADGGTPDPRLASLPSAAPMYQSIQQQQDLVNNWSSGAASTQDAIAGLLELMKSKGIDSSITSGYRSGSKTKQGKASRHSKNEAVDIKIPALGKNAYDAMLGDKDIVGYMLNNGLTAINEYDPNIAKKTGATGGHVHIGLDKGTKTADAFRTAAAQKHPDVLQKMTGSAPIINSAGLPELPASDVRYLQDLYEKAKAAGKGPAVLKFQQEYHRLAPNNAKAVIGNDPLTNYAKKKGYGIGDLRGNEDSLFGQRTMDYNSAIQSQPIKSLPSKTIKGLGNLPLPTLTMPKQDGVASTNANQSDLFENISLGVSSLMPFLDRFRPSNQLPFDPSQLMAENYVLATNQIQPVKAQTVQPLLAQPYDISYQDQLNANQSDFNALLRLGGNNPELMSGLAGQKYAANASVLGNQFRANQAERANVYNQNRQVLNQTNLQNLGILDQQMVRQEEAKSKTIDKNTAVLNSMSSKMAQNKLENRTLGVYENMYNYRFAPNGVAYNLNAPYSWNMAGQPGSTSRNPSGLMQDAQGNTLLPEYNDDGTIKSYKPKKDKAKNGAIVKAIKGL